MNREDDLRRQAEKYPFPIPEPAKKKLKKGLDKVPTRKLPGRRSPTPQVSGSTEERSNADAETR